MALTISRTNIEMAIYMLKQINEGPHGHGGSCCS